MPAERLHAAAAVLRNLDQLATPGPWAADVETRGDCVLWGPNGQFVANAQAEPHWLPAADGGQRAVMFDADRRDVKLIERLRPLASLIADLLDGYTGICEEEAGQGTNVAVIYRDELAVADAVLASVQEARRGE